MLQAEAAKAQASDHHLIVTYVDNTRAHCGIECGTASVVDEILASGAPIFAAEATHDLVAYPLSANPTHLRDAGGSLWRKDGSCTLAADLKQNPAMNHVQVLDALAAMGFALFACPVCDWAHKYVLVRRTAQSHATPLGER